MRVRTSEGGRFVKRRRPGADTAWWADAARNEARFYARLAGVEGVPAARFFRAEADDRGGTVLVLEDLGSTHRPATWARAPDLTGAVEALARLHAALRAHRLLNPPRQADPLQWRRELGRRVDAMARAHPGIVGADTLARQHEVIEWSGWDRWVEQVAADPQRTLVHGDAHPANVMIPLDGSDDVRYIDWEMNDTGYGVSDLAFLLVFGAPPEAWDSLTIAYVRSGGSIEQLDVAMASQVLMVSAMWANGANEDRLRRSMAAAEKALQRHPLR